MSSQEGELCVGCSRRVRVLVSCIKAAAGWHFMNLDKRYLFYFHRQSLSYSLERIHRLRHLRPPPYSKPSRRCTASLILLSPRPTADSPRGNKHAPTVCQLPSTKVTQALDLSGQPTSSLQSLCCPAGILELPPVRNIHKANADWMPHPP